MKRYLPLESSDESVRGRDDLGILIGLIFHSGSGVDDSVDGFDQQFESVSHSADEEISILGRHLSEGIESADVVCPVLEAAFEIVDESDQLQVRGTTRSVRLKEPARVVRDLTSLQRRENDSREEEGDDGRKDLNTRGQSYHLLSRIRLGTEILERAELEACFDVALEHSDDGIEIAFYQGVECAIGQL